VRISRDKLDKLAHTVADTLAEIPEVDLTENFEKRVYEDLCRGTGLKIGSGEVFAGRKA